LATQFLPAGQGCMADEVVERVVDRQSGLSGVGQAVEVGQDLRPVAQLVIELASGAELEQVQSQAPPGEEAGGVGAGFLNTCVGQTLEPVVEVRETVTDGLDEGPSGAQGRPALSFRFRALARSRATES